MPIGILLGSCWAVNEQAVPSVPVPCHIPPSQPPAGSISSPQGAAGISEDPEKEWRLKWQSTKLKGMCKIYLPSSN